MIEIIRKLLDWLASLRRPVASETIYDEERPVQARTAPIPVPAGDLRLSPHFLLSEFTRSSVAAARDIDNTPGAEHLANLRELAATLEHVRAVLGHPILISSGYRSPELNRVVGGSATSDHAKGLAADFTCPDFGPVQAICEAIVAAGIPFDQLIFEQGATEWVHLGIGRRMRRQALSWAPAQGYVSGIRGLP